MPLLEGIGVLKGAAAAVKELELEEELVPVPAQRQAEAEKAAAVAPLIHSFPLNEDLAAEFMAEEFPWDENGAEFLARFGTSPLSITEIAGMNPRSDDDPEDELFDDVSDDLDDHATSGISEFLPRIRAAINRAFRAGLLTITCEREQELYSLAEGIDVPSLLMSRKIDRLPLDEQEALRFLTERFSSEGTDHLRPFSGRYFLAIFEHGYTMTDMFNDHRLYRKGEVQFDMPVRRFLTGLLNRAFECGLLERRYLSRSGRGLQEVYYPRDPGQDEAPETGTR